MWKRRFPCLEGSSDRGKLESAVRKYLKWRFSDLTGIPEWKTFGSWEEARAMASSMGQQWENT